MAALSSAGVAFGSTLTACVLPPCLMRTLVRRDQAECRNSLGSRADIAYLSLQKVSKTSSRRSATRGRIHRSRGGSSFKQKVRSMTRRQLQKKQKMHHSSRPSLSLALCIGFSLGDDPYHVYSARSPVQHRRVFQYWGKPLS